MTTPARGSTGGMKSAYASPSRVPSSGRAGRGCFILAGIMATMGQQGIAGLEHVFPLGSTLNEAGRLEVGGCDVVELAAEFGTPAYVYAEDDIRARARAYVEAFRARTEPVGEAPGSAGRVRRNFEVLYASKAFPCVAAFRLMAEEGLSVDVASGGELYLALAGGHDPARIYMHGNNKTEAELTYALEQGVGTIVV